YSCHHYAFSPHVVTTLPPSISTLFPYTALVPISVIENIGIESLAGNRGMLERGEIMLLQTVIDKHAEHRRRTAERSDLVLSNQRDRKSTRLNSSHVSTSYAVFCLKKKNIIHLYKI